MASFFTFSLSHTIFMVSFAIVSIIIVLFSIVHLSNIQFNKSFVENVKLIHFSFILLAGKDCTSAVKLKLYLARTYFVSDQNTWNVSKVAKSQIDCDVFSKIQWYPLLNNKQINLMIELSNKRFRSSV